MALHRLASVTMGVPNVDDVADYYADFGLVRDESGADDVWFATQDGGRQLRIVPAASRRLVDLSVAVDDEDDLARAHSNLVGLGLDVQLAQGSLSAVEPVTGTV